MRLCLQETVTSGSVIVTSGNEILTSGNDIVTSGNDIVAFLDCDNMKWDHDFSSGIFIFLDKRGNVD